MADQTLFQKIESGEMDADIIYEDEQCFAIRDINPQAPTHLLIVPRKPLHDLNELRDGDETLVGHLFLVAQKLASDEGVGKGYRTVFNCGADAGQSVGHLHLHLLGGRKLAWPPG